MRVEADVAWMLGVVLIALRLGVVLVATPIFNLVNVPGNIRVLFVLGLAAVIAAGIKNPLVIGELSVYGFLAAATVELIIGAALAFGLLTAFAAFALGGRVVDVQLGFGVANLIDPATRTPAPLVGTFLNLLALVIFFAIDGHHMVLRGIVFSLEQTPPGTALPDLDIGVLAAQFGGMFVYAVSLVAPVMFGILLIDVLLGVIARMMPQMNVFIVGLPLKIFVGLSLLAFSLNYLSPALARVFEGVFNGWHRLLG